MHGPLRGRREADNVSDDASSQNIYIIDGGYDPEQQTFFMAAAEVAAAADDDSMSVDQLL